MVSLGTREVFRKSLNVKKKVHDTFFMDSVLFLVLIFLVLGIYDFANTWYYKRISPDVQCPEGYEVLINGDCMDHSYRMLILVLINVVVLIFASLTLLIIRYIKKEINTGLIGF